ncbi:MAG: ABC transporter ATP-binding protein [Verrucomicrobiota bacterium]|nr:ABC transporter ATP-binding protein [Verrucomicrobiota bacterium]
MKLSLSHISKSFGETLVVDDVSIEVGEGRFFFLIGPSGCGKSTLLRMISGFTNPDKGTIVLGDKPLTSVPAHLRNTGMVFQNYALFPHLSVFENVAYGLRVKGQSDDSVKEDVRAMLKIVRLENYNERMPHELSGGQQQRVALARALVIKPDLLLFDEPLSNLDARLRLELREEIRRIHKELNITSIYVTHDQEEALAMADEIAIMNKGRIEHVGSPRDLYRRPKSRFVADFIGDMNWLPGKVSALVEDYVGTVETPVGPWKVEFFEKPQLNQTVWCGVRPERIKIGSDGGNTLKSTVVDTAFMGNHELVRVKIGTGEMWKVKLPRLAIDLEVGQSLPLVVPTPDVLVLNNIV